MNTRLLRKVQREILKRPTQVEMDHWFYRGDGYTRVGKIEACGTAGCIVGWALTLGNNYKRIADAFRMGWLLDDGRKILDLEVEPAWILFFTDYWPQPFKRRYYDAKTAKTRAKAVSDRIDLFIKTKGKE